MEKHNSNISCANVFNILNFLFSKNILNEETLFEKIVDCFSLRVLGFSIKFDLLSKLIDYYLGGDAIYNYEDTGFKIVFDKLLAERESFSDKISLFINMFNSVDITNLSVEVLLSLIRKLLEHNPILDPQEILNNWLIYCGLQRKIEIDADSFVSKAHQELWHKYKEVTDFLNDTMYEDEFLLKDVIKKMNDKIKRGAFENLKASFVKGSREYQYLESIIENTGF
ncbi:hypothetical protein [Acinetobacter pittii]|uniref:hypothetical protein n=1 Tax=Acinetobacter pittii TaxID=48296 RepID=UPI00301659C7